jgi:hypothetical protein
MLPLTFANPADYDKVQEDDRISILGLTSLKPGVPLQMILKHADGSVDEVILNHTFNENQIGWFKAGSALNLIAAQGKKNAIAAQPKAKKVAKKIVAKKKAAKRVVKKAVKKVKPKTKKKGAKNVLKAAQKKKAVKKIKRNLRKK